MSVDLESLGFTQEELQDRVVERLCDLAMDTTSFDDEGREHGHNSPFATKLRELVAKRVDAAIAALAEKHVLPNVTAYIEALTMQETNKWGEKVKAPLTFIEYLAQRAQAYLEEKVDFKGKSKSESDGYSWSGTQTRLTHIVHEHLHYSISTAMQQAIASANKSIVDGLAETVKLKLADLSTTLKVSLETKEKR